MASVHFWTRNPEALEPWAPDEDPDRHLSAYGHAFLELYWRMHARGLSVTIGPVVPPDCDSVVVIMHELIGTGYSTLSRETATLAAQALRRRRPPAIVVIRVDLPLAAPTPSIASLTVMPTRAAVEHPRETWLPMLPNRGLQPRDEARRDRLETVALKAYSYNVPAWLDEGFVHALRSRGLDLRVDTELNGRWGDFTEVDVALCVHEPETLVDDRRKPATKLVNAWRAGAIPVCGPYTAYREIGRPDETMVISDDSGEAYLGALVSLQERPDVAARIRARLPEEASRFAPDHIADEWWSACLAAPRASRRRLAGSLVSTSWGLAIRKLRRMRSQGE